MEVCAVCTSVGIGQGGGKGTKNITEHKDSVSCRVPLNRIKDYLRTFQGQN